MLRNRTMTYCGDGHGIYAGTYIDLDEFILESSWMEWLCVAVGRRDFWLINGALGSQIAMIPEGAD